MARRRSLLGMLLGGILREVFRPRRRRRKPKSFIRKRRPPKKDI